MTKKLFSMLAWCQLFSAACAEGMDLTTVGSLPVVNIPVTVLSSAGTQPTGSYQYSSSTSLTISNTKNKNDRWRIEVRQSVTQWRPEVKLWIKRSANGTGLGGISGGDTFQEVTGTDLPLFTGSGDRDGITLTFQLTGLSLAVPMGSYNSSVVLTLVDI